MKTKWGEARKWVGRHRGWLAGGAVIIVVLAAAAGLYLRRQGWPMSLIAEPCKGPESQRVDCFDKYFNGVIRSQGAPEAERQIEYFAAHDQAVEADCHPIMHTIGRNAYRFYGSVTAATKYATEFCWSGYYHGVMEAYMAQFDDAKLMTQMPKICQQTPGKPYSFDYYNCLHGLGHGVTIRFNNDIMKALPYCDALIGQWEQESCYSGAFMQNIVVDGVNHKSVNLKADDPVYPCDVVPDRMKESCYLMVTSNILKVNGYDYAAGFKTCDAVEADYVATCYQSEGRDISGAMLLDPAKIVPLCDEGAPEHQADCVIGAVKNAVFNDRGVTRADALCRAVDGRFTAVCDQARNEAASTL